jgi:hypothetical protein
MIRILLFTGLMMLLTMPFTAKAQPAVQVEPSYDVQLQLVIGSNDATQKGDLPAGLGAAASRQIRSFGFSNHKLASTLLGRVGNNGDFHYKSLTNIFGQEVDLRSQTFLEWSVNDLRGLPMPKGGPGYQAGGFRFGARVPVVTGQGKDDAGKPFPVTAFEPIGLTLDRLGLAENTPTLVGTLNLPGAGGTIFLVMTVKAVDM